MTTIITSPHGSTSPTLWLEYDSTRDAGTLAHPDATGGVIVVHRPTGPRKLALALFYGGPGSEAASAACEALHAAGGVLTITETDRATLGMSYVVTGAIRRSLDVEHDVWTVEAEVCEVPA